MHNVSETDDSDTEQEDEYNYYTVNIINTMVDRNDQACEIHNVS